MFKTIAIILLASILVLPGASAATELEETSTSIFDKRRAEASVGAERSSSGSGSSTGSAESAADLWNRRCSRAGIGVYNPDEAGSFTSVRDRVGDAVGTITEAYYTENATSDSPGALTIGQLNTISVPAVGGYGYYRTTCVAGTRTSVIGQVLFDGTETSPWQVRNQAQALLKIPAPEPRAAPSLTESYSIVKIPTWFWTENTELTQTASDGTLSVSVTATPISTTWNPGDRSLPLICPDGGTPWQEGLKETDTNCSHTYTKSTAGLPGDALTITTTITWELSWTLDGTDQGTFETFENTTNTSHQVGEIQTHNVPNQ